MESNSARVETQMLIRKSAGEVFNAFIDPAHTQQFWFTKSSGKLITGQEVSWTWEMYGVSVKVLPTEIIPNERIRFDWSSGNEATTVEFDFKSLSPKATYVSVVHSGFTQTGDELTAALTDSTGGFTMVLAGLKAYLEHQIQLNLIGDKFPAELRGK